MIKIWTIVVNYWTLWGARSLTRASDMATHQEKNHHWSHFAGSNHHKGLKFLSDLRGPWIKGDSISKSKVDPLLHIWSGRVVWVGPSLYIVELGERGRVWFVGVPGEVMRPPVGVFARVDKGDALRLPVPVSLVEGTEKVPLRMRWRLFTYKYVTSTKDLRNTQGTASVVIPLS